MRTFSDFSPDTIIVVVQAAHPDFQPGVYLPPAKWGSTVGDVKRSCLDWIEKYQALPLTPIESTEQVFVLKAACLSVKVTTLGRLEEVLAELAESEMAMPNAGEESFADMNTNDTTKPAPFEVIDDRYEDALDEARSIGADLEAEDPRYNEALDEEEEDVAPPWGAVPQKGPPA